MKQPGLDNRHRDENPPKAGEIRQKRSDTINKNLPVPIPHFSPNAKFEHNAAGHWKGQRPCGTTSGQEPVDRETGMADVGEQDSEVCATYTPEEYAAHMEERKTLIEAARESAKTFDQAMLAFGSAIFGASIAFLKDVAPHPQTFTIKWLGGAWILFSAGLLAALMSFIWSHKACMSEIDAASATLGKPNAQRPANRWSAMTDKCNYCCVALLFLGLTSWSVFALENLTIGGNTVAQQSQNQPPQPYEKLEKGYVPPKAPPPPPRTNQSNVPPTSQSPKK